MARPPIRTIKGHFLPLVQRPGGQEYEKGVLLPQQLPETAAVSDAIRFNITNLGGYLKITTRNTEVGGLGFDLQDISGGGIGISQFSGSADSQIELAPDGSISIFTSPGPSNPLIAITSATTLTLAAQTHVTVGPSLALTGLSGATAASRYVGATNSGAPGSGTFAIGDFSVDRSGAMWVCTAAGSPGTWVEVGTGTGAVSSVFSRTGAVAAVNGDYYGVVAAHLTGATAASRYVGATASGAPVSGTFAVGDFIVDQTGAFWVCTVAGTPGTWVGTGGGGIAFATANSGTYLDITTTGVDGGGYGFNFHDSDASSQGFTFLTDQGGIALSAPLGNVNLLGAFLSLTSSGVAVDVQTGVGVAVTLESGTPVIVYDHASAPIFQINEDGSLQGKTGKSLVFNL